MVTTTSVRKEVRELIQSLISKRINIWLSIPQYYQGWGCSVSVYGSQELFFPSIKKKN